MLLAIYALCSWLGIFRLFYAINRNRALNITYHNVLPDDVYDNSVHLGMSHPSSIFETQILHINRRWPITTDPDQPGTCRITFDDGYRNQKVVAARILENHGLRGVFFVPFEPLESGKTLIVDRILQWISYVIPGLYRFGGLTVDISENSRRLPAFRMIYQHLLANPEHWQSIVDELNQASPFAALEIDPTMDSLRFTPLTIRDLDEMRARGHRIGCHGWDHKPLSTLRAEFVSEEFDRCRERVPEYCSCSEFSYPFGGEAEVSSMVAKACRRANFSHGFLNVEKVPSSLSVMGQYALGRVSLPRESSPYLLDAKLSGFERFVKQILRRS